MKKDFLVQAIAENKSLLTLDLGSVVFTDDIWIALWRSVARHPKSDIKSKTQDPILSF
jgi:hypothetical protein